MIRDITLAGIFVIAILLGTAKCANAKDVYILTLLNEQRTAELFQYFSTFESCRAARSTILAALGKYDERYYVTCTPEVSK